MCNLVHKYNRDFFVLEACTYNTGFIDGDVISNFSDMTKKSESPSGQKY